MTSKKTWFITGAGRGMGVEFAKAALTAGHNVVATGRNRDTVAKALGAADDLLVVKLDVTSPEDAEAAVQAAVDRFGGIDVLVNNAASFYAGYFEELTPEQIERQLTTSLIGPQPPRRFIAGADAIAQAEQQVAQFQAEIDAFRDLSSSLALDEAEQGAPLS